MQLPLKKIIPVILLVSGLFMVGQAAFIHIKAALAQVLIAQAYSKQIESGTQQQPWPWADTNIVSKLNIKNQSHYVLAGASGRNLAFGPAHMTSTVSPGNAGNSVIVGHRDTHFKSLQYLSIGETISVESKGVKIHYIVTQTAIVDEKQSQVTAPTQSNVLTLITCYPFNDISPNPTQRFVVRAMKIS